MKKHSLPVTLRPMEPTDASFLLNVYASTRTHELQAWGWDAAQRDMFVAMQWSAQQQGYRTQFPHAQQHIVCLEACCVGYLTVDAHDEVVHIVDIALLPPYRNNGIGGTLLQNVLAHATHDGQRVRLRVVHNNPARRLYARLGFQVMADTGTHYIMEVEPRT
jgi:ribosomal protein S18 acetylase RimI-like enzyme